MLTPLTSSSTEMQPQRTLQASSFWILGIICALFVVGAAMVFNTSSAEILDRSLDKNVYQPFLKQLLYGVVAVGWGYLGWRLTFRFFLSHAAIGLGILLFLLLLVLIPGVGVMANGSRRWLSLFSLSFQPSEFAKILVPLFLLSQWKEGTHYSLKKLLKMLWPAVLTMALILVEPDNRTTGIIGLTLLVTFLMMRIPARYWALPMALLIVAGGAVAINVPYVAKRLNVYLHPEADLQGKGHQPYQAKIALGSGGVWGKGWGESLQKFTYLPEAQNDYIVAIFAEETGFIGMLILILAYLSLAGIGFGQALLHPDPLVSKVIALLTFIITFQAFMNFGVVSGLLPSTGLNLPFFSQGGTSLCANAFTIGLLLSALACADKKQRGYNQP